MKNNSAKILIIDDEQVVIDSLTKICSLENHSTRSALDAEAGLKILDDENFDLIICDIMLPEMDGFQFLEKLRHKKIETPVIMTTGYSTVENAVKSLHDGAIDFIPKPFTVDEILAALQRGMKLISIKEKVKNSDNTSIVYVECPSKYHRLGFSSWTFIEDKGSALIGATDLYLNIIDEFHSIDFKEVNEELYQGTSCAKFNSENNLSHDLLSPVSGKIIEVNQEVVSNINIIQKDPFFKGWLYRVIPSDIEYEVKNLTSCSSGEF